MPPIIPVILAGGAGKRLWPVSRHNTPKPFLNLTGDLTLLQLTYTRLEKCLPRKNLNSNVPLITVTNQDYIYHTLNNYQPLELSNKFDHHILLEPEGRNTAPAIALAAQYIKHNWGDDALMLVLPADHIIEGSEYFTHVLELAATAALSHNVVVFGIEPSEANTGYGYISCGDVTYYDPVYNANISKVKNFIEKPSLSVAQGLIDSGHLWNSGMFMLNPTKLLQEYRAHLPHIHEMIPALVEHLEIVPDASSPGCEIRKISLEYNKCSNVSFDYGILEKADSVAVVACNLLWNDIGSWQSVHKLEQGSGRHSEVYKLDANNCYVHPPYHRPNKVVALLGTKDIMVVDTNDALLIADKSYSEQVKFLANQLEEKQHPAYFSHPTVDRPWGNYTVLEEGPCFKVKRIVLKPNASISLQLHRYRSEHWVVVEGQAEVINGDSVLELGANESTYIPAGKKHRLRNITKNNLVVIEVQVGAYLGEDDIIRFDDEYGRQETVTRVNIEPVQI